MAARTIIDRDLGLKRIMAAIRGFDRVVATVGVHADDKTREEEEPGGAVSNVYLAVIHEFGAPNAKYPIPERSFLRRAFDKNVKKYEDLLAKAAKTMSPQNAVAFVAEEAVADVIKEIDDGIPPPNAPMTIALKGSSKPLIHTGQLKTSIKPKIGRL